MKNLKIKLLFALCAILLFSAFITEKKDVITIFMIGDSTMANKSLKDGNLERGWGQMLPCFLTEDVAVDNHAMNGRSSLSFINEGRWDAVLAKLNIDDNKANEVINNLKNRYQAKEFGIDIKVLGERYKMITKVENRDYLQKLIDVTESDTLTNASLETLAIIAYNQPITRVEVDETRGVGSAHIIRRLVYKGLIEEVGRAETAGRPILYATTPLFLDYFGLKSIKDLPEVDIQKELESKELYMSKYTEDDL